MPPKKTESEVAVFLKHVFLGVSIAAGLYAAIDQRISVAETRIEKRVEKLEAEHSALRDYVYRDRK